jgi:anti-sigma regulatory factor (Ser/Thr protein kinase)
VIRIAIDSEPRLLNILRGVVKFRAHEAGLPNSDAEYVALAIDEAAANVIRHTYGSRHDARMALEVRCLPDRLEFILEDWGPKVCEESIRPRSLDELRPGGLGTFFIYRFMDECSYDPGFKEGNRLKLVKFLKRKGAGCNDEGSSAKSG